MREITGWLSDLYEHPQKRLVIWLVGEDGKPYFCFYQDFETVFYAGGPFPRLKELWKFLRTKPVKLEKVSIEDLYDGSQEGCKFKSPSLLTHKSCFEKCMNTFLI